MIKFFIYFKKWKNSNSQSMNANVNIVIMTFYDCENSFPNCDIEIKQELEYGNNNKQEVPKYYLYEYLEDSNSFYNLGKFSADELPPVKIGNKVYNYFDDCYEAMLKLFNQIIIPE